MIDLTDIERARELAQRGAHRLSCRVASRSPRKYQATCRDCSYLGTVGTGATATREILVHAQVTYTNAQYTPAAPATVSPVNPVVVSAAENEPIADAVEEPEPAFRGSPDLDEEHRKLIPSKSRFKAYVPRGMDGTTDYAIVKKAAEAGRNILLMSDAGAGKNHLAEALAADLEVPLICISLNADVQVEDLVGGLSFAGSSQGTVWVDGYFSDFMRLAQSGQRCVLVLDEVNSPGHGVIFRLHQSLDERRALVLAEKGRETLRDPEHNLVVIGTMNPDYRGTKPLNQAFKRRFQVKLTLDYDLSVERRLLMAKRYNGVEDLLKLAGALRKSYHDTDLTQPIGTADLLNYADNTRLFGESIARHCLLQNYEADERQAVQEAISLHLDKSVTTAASADMPL